MAQPRSYPKIVQNIVGCVQDVKKEYTDTKLPITDDSLALHKLCAKLEYLLQIDMKGRTGVLGGRRDYWDYFYKCLRKVKGLNDGVRFVRAMTEVKSSLGRGRAFIRYSLVHHRLGDSVQQCVSNTKISSDWYNPMAVLLNTVQSSTIVNALYDLNDVQFDLSPTGYDLDTAWPTFARRMSSGVSGLYLWKPPSRTTSTSSINSQQSTSDSYPNSPMIESRSSDLEDQISRLQREFDECEAVNRQLRQRIDQLEQDNDEIHQMAQETEERLAEVKSSSAKSILDLKEQIKRLEEIQSLKEEELLGLEAKWKDRVLDAEKTASDLYARIEVLNKQHESREKMLMESEKKLRENLHAAEGTVSELKELLSKQKIGMTSKMASEVSAKQRVLELESKLADAENRNLELITRMDSIVQNKDKTVSSHFESASKVHDLLMRLEGSEIEKLQLQGIKEELIRKLELSEMQNSAEGKSNPMVSENETSQSTSSQEPFQQYLTQIRVLENSKQKLESRNDELGNKVQNLEGAIQKSASEKGMFEKRTIELKRTISNFEESDSLLREEKETLQKNLTLVRNERDETLKKLATLEQRNEQVKELENQSVGFENQLAALRKENSELLRTKLSFEQLLKNLERQEAVSSIEKSSADQQIKYEALQNSASETNGSTKLVEGEIPNDSIETKIENILTQNALGVSNLWAAKSEIADLKAQKEELEKHLTKVREKQQQNTSEVSSLRETIEHLQGKLADAGLRAESHRKTMSEKETELTSLAQQMSSLQQRVADLKESIVQKSLDLETTQQNLGQVNLQVKTLKTSIEETSVEKAALGTKLTSLKADLETLKKENKLLENEKLQTRECNQEITESLERQKQVNKDLQSSLEDTRRLVEENVSLEQIFEDRKQKMIKEHEDKVEFLTHQFHSLQNEMEKVSAEKSHFETEHQAMSVVVQEMQERVELIETERNEIKKTNDTLNTEIARVNEAMQLAVGEKEQMAKDLEQLRSEMFDALEGNTARMLRLENELHNAREERDKGKAQICELEAELTEVKETLTQAEQKCKETSEQLGSLQCVMEQEVSALKFQLSSEAMGYQQTIQGYKNKEAALQELQDRTLEQEEALERLQAELNLTTAQLEQQQQQAVAGREALADKECERLALQEAIQQMSETMEELQLRNLNSEEELATNQDKKSTLETKLSELEDDNVELKKQIIKLIRDKDTLWQWNDKLDYLRKTKASERWIEDKEVTHCMQCRVEFSLMIRRHHCRLCGRIFCTKCANCYVSAAHSRKKSRVCEQCFIIHEHAKEANEPTQSTRMLRPDSDDDSMETEALARSVSFIGSHSDDLCSTPTTEAASSHEGTPPVESSPDPRIGGKESAACDKIMPHDASCQGSVEGKPVSLSGKERTPVLGSESSTYLDADPHENPVIVLDSPLPSRRSLPSSNDEKEYEVISEEEVVAAKRDWTPSPTDSPGGLMGAYRIGEKSTFTSPTIHVNELESGHKADDEILIKAGQSHAVPIHLDAPGIVLCWEFASAPKTVAFSVTYRPVEPPSPTNGSPGQQQQQQQLEESLIPLGKCNSHRHAVQGEMLARKAGIYTLLFDNSFSRFTQKTVKYSLQVKRPEAAY